MLATSGLGFGLLLLLLLLPLDRAAGAGADPLQAGFASQYTLHYNGLRLGVAERDLIPLGDGTAVFRSLAYPTGLARALVSDRVEERSLITLEANGLRPLEYRYQQSGGRRERQAELYFNWRGGELVRRPADERSPLAAGTLDTLSFQLALMRDLAAGRQAFSYRIADRRKLREFAFTVHGAQRVKTSFGSFDTLRVTALSADGEKRFEFWCAPELAYLPVRLVYEDEGDTTRLELTGYTPRGNR